MSEESQLTFEDLVGEETKTWTEETTDGEYNRISQLAELLQQNEKIVQQLELELEEAKNNLKTVREVDLPEAMQAANLKQITLTDGSSIKVEEFYKAHISEANRPAAHAWLVQNGHAGIIKHEVTVKFGKDENKKADDAINKLKQLGHEPSVKQGVHPQTLNAFVKEQLTKGKDIPSETFGIYVGSRAKIK